MVIFGVKKLLWLFLVLKSCCGYFWCYKVVVIFGVIKLWLFLVLKGCCGYLFCVKKVVVVIFRVKTLRWLSSLCSFPSVCFFHSWTRYIYISLGLPTKFVKLRNEDHTCLSCHVTE